MKPTTTTTPQRQQQAGNDAYPFPDSQFDGELPQYESDIYPINTHHEPQHERQMLPSFPTYGTFPVYPGVTLRRLPFYDVLVELLKPSTLIPLGSQKLKQSNFEFYLTPDQARDIATEENLRAGSEIDKNIQVQLRFCLMETTCEQNDCYPPGVCVNVNSIRCPLQNHTPNSNPGIEPKRPPRPINITPLVRTCSTSANQVTVFWNTDHGEAYVVAIHLVSKISSRELLQRLKRRGSRHADCTRGLIKEKLKVHLHLEIAPTSLRVSLLCPLGRMRMVTPCRSCNCNHLQCFDALTYLQMNERNPSWMCPACDKPARYDTLMIDGYFQEVLASGKLGDENEIQLHKDGSWSSFVRKKRQTQQLAVVADEEYVKRELDNILVIPLSKGAAILQPIQETPVIDLTSSDSDDESHRSKIIRIHYYS